MSHHDPQNQKDQDTDTTGDNIKKVAVGAAVVAGAAAVVGAMRDEETRGKVVNAVKEAGSQAANAAAQMRDKGMEMAKEMQDGGNKLIADLTSQFDELKTQIEESDAAKDFKDKVAELGEQLNEARDVGEDKAEDVASDIQERMEKLKADFDKKAA